MIQYIIIFEYATASVVIESIEFARYQDFARFDFDTYILSTKTTMCRDFDIKKYLFANK